MRKLLISVVQVLLITIFCGDILKAGESDFRRDVLEVTYNQWTQDNQARLQNAGDIQPDQFGFSQLRTYQTRIGDVKLLFLSDYDEKIYDIVAPVSDQIQLPSPELKRIVERLLWHLQLSDASHLNSIFSTFPTALKFHFGEVGGLSGQMNSFIQNRGNNWRLTSWGLEELDAHKFLFFTEVNGRELKIEIQPTLNLYLNGQVDVLSQSIKTILNPEFGIHAISQVYGRNKNFSIDGDKASVSLYNRDSEKNTVYFTKNNQGNFDYTTTSSDWNDDAIKEFLNSRWAGWHVPDISVEKSLASVSKVDVRLESDLIESFTNVSPTVVDQMGVFLGVNKVLLLDVDSISREDGSFTSVVHLRYVDPELQFIHVVRVTEQFGLQRNGPRHVDSKIDLILSVRMDNVRSLYGEAADNDAGRTLFKINVD